MITTHIDIDNNKWGILFCYNFDMLDWDDMAALMAALGMGDGDINKSIRILSQPNTGMAVSNDDLRMTLIFVSDATSNAQFWSTVAHELKHAQDAIIEYYGKSLNGEPAAYTMGYLMQRVVEEIAEPCY